MPDQTPKALVAVLHWGFRFALALLLTGVALAVVRGDGLTRHVEPIRSLPAGIWHGRSAAFVDAGFVVLLVTPASCVATVLVGFVRRRNWPLAAATAVVLGTLGVGLAEGFEEQDRAAARNFGAAARAAGVRRIIYLGGLGEAGRATSPHLRSRQEVGDLLRGSGVEVIEFRASVILGLGSLSKDRGRED